MQGNEAQSEANWDFRTTIPSQPAKSSELIKEVLDRVKQKGWTESELFGVHMALEEALMNAIKHGNQYDDGKSVQFECCLNSTEVEIRVTDEGEGFKPEDVPDPTADENLDKDSGRGLLLMRSFMSHVEFNDRGNSVFMRKQRDT